MNILRTIHENRFQGVEIWEAFDWEVSYFQRNPASPAWPILRNSVARETINSLKWFPRRSSWDVLITWFITFLWKSFIVLVPYRKSKLECTVLGNNLFLLHWDVTNWFLTRCLFGCICHVFILLHNFHFQQQYRFLTVFSRNLGLAFKLLLRWCVYYDLLLFVNCRSCVMLSVIILRSSELAVRRRGASSGASESGWMKERWPASGAARRPACTLYGLAE